MYNVFLCPDCVATRLRKNSTHFWAKILAPLVEDTNDHMVCLDKKGRLLERYEQIEDKYGLLTPWIRLAKDEGKLRRSQRDCSCDCIKELGMLSLDSFDEDKLAVVTDRDYYQSLVSNKNISSVHIVGHNEAAELFSKESSITRFSFPEFEKNLIRLLGTVVKRILKKEKEDYITAYLYDLLSEKYEADFQSIGGASESAKSSGERDLVVLHHKDEKVVLEAICLESVGADGEYKELKKHIKKAYSNYNPLQLNHVYHLVYYQGTNFNKHWSEYQGYLSNNFELADGNLSEPIVEGKGSFRTIDTMHDNIRLTHFFCDFSQKATNLKV